MLTLLYTLGGGGYALKDVRSLSLAKRQANAKHILIRIGDM